MCGGTRLHAVPFSLIASITSPEVSLSMRYVLGAIPVYLNIWRSLVHVCVVELEVLFFNGSAMTQLAS